MNDEEIATIERRANDATEGPWRAAAYRPTPDSPGSYNTVIASDANICGLHDGGQTRESIDANAHFIAHAREDIPALVAEVRHLRTLLHAVQRRARDELGIDF